MRRPSLRVRCFADVADETKDELQKDLEVLKTILPFRIFDFEVVGSAARDEWDLRSDLDICLRTNEGWLPNGGLWRVDPAASRKALRYVRTLYDKWGVLFALTTEEPSVANNPHKTCYALIERVHYHPDKKQRVDVDLETGAVTPRQRRFVNRDFNLGWIDADGNNHSEGEEQYPEEVAIWSQRLGDKYLHIGNTPDTEYLN